jgi:arylsulfatase A-like enzyme
MKRLVTVFSLFIIAATVAAQDRPNILWITSEDNSYHWIGCYGDDDAKTPNIDKLAADGIRYKYAYANAPVCAVARFTLITGRYAPSMGCQNMRSRYPIPAQFKTYPSYMRAAGYYCVNKSKTDYNFATNDKSHWDECSGGAHWKKRPKGKPFFAVFNTTKSHESSLFSKKTAAYKKSGDISNKPRVSPDSVTLPPYLPDTKAIRSDWVTYMDIITAMDKQVGAWLKELDDEGVAENTIVIHYADHGGILPRAKRYIYDTGTRVPMIVRFPKKWQHLAPQKPGTVSERPVSFIDLPPTLFSLAGVDIPEAFHGRAFLGEKRQNPADYVFLYGQRFDARMIRFVRAVTDGQYRYIRNFNPHLHRGILAGYPHGQAGWLSFYDKYKADNLSPAQAAFWQRPQPVEELYDTTSDPWEVKNLANDPAHAARLKKMRTAVLSKMTEIRDSGMVPESMYKEISADSTVYDYVNSKDFPYEEILQLSLKAGEGKDLAALQAAMKSEHPVKRYWGAIGCTNMGKAASGAKSQLQKLAKDKRLAVRIAAAEALAAIGDEQAAVDGLSSVMKESQDEMVVLTALNTMEAIGVRSKIAPDVLKTATNVNGYPKRIATPVK